MINHRSMKKLNFSMRLPPLSMAVVRPLSSTQRIMLPMQRMRHNMLSSVPLHQHTRTALAPIHFQSRLTLTRQVSSQNLEK
jgi:hypothetical protein